MRSLQDEIRQAQKELHCPVCQRSFELKDIQLRNFSPKAAELSVICNRGHAPIILLIPLNLKEVRSAGLITKQELNRTLKKIESIRDSFSEIN
jgi:hypothetical protein